MNRVQTLSEKPLLAFVHIPKAGGTTLIHLLRRNYFMTYCDVRPLKNRGKKLFCAEDMRIYLRLNPFIQCIGGHAVRPYSDLETLFPNIRYITVLRDPVQRCISHYQQRVMKFGKISFDEFLEREWVSNLQTRHIAGSEDVELAKAMLSQRFFAVGVLDQFDEFLGILAQKLAPRPFDPRYRMMRVATNKDSKQQILETNKDSIVDSHRADLELYEYAKQELMPAQRNACGPTLESIVSGLRQSSDTSAPSQSKQRLDYVFRKIYYEPVSGLIRALNGLPAGKH